MHAREFELLLASHTQAWGRSEIEQRTMRLRKAGLLPIGGRGPHAPGITAKNAATILISLAASAHAAAGAQAVDTYASMRAIRPPKFARNATFGDALEAILSDPEKCLGVSEVVICRTWPGALIRYQDPDGRGQETYYRSPRVSTATGDVREEITLTHRILRELAIELAGLNDPKGAGGVNG
jgi:hypothetical protein